MDVEFYASLCCEAILYGIYTILFVAAMYLMIRRRQSTSSKHVHTTIICMSAVMFSVSTIHMGLSIRVFFDAFLRVGSWWDPSTPGTDSLCITKLFIHAINFILSDGIVIWRAYLLWNFNALVCFIPGILVIATGVVAIVGAQQSTANKATIVLDASYPWVLAMNCLTLATNILVTALIAYRARSYRQATKHTVPSREGRQSRWILALLIESGSLYCFTWVVFFIIYWCKTHGIFLITDIFAQLTGIYSTLIIFLVALKMTYKDDEDDYTPDSTSHKFDAPMQNHTTSTFSGASDTHRLPPIVIHVMNTVEDDRRSAHGEKSLRSPRRSLRTPRDVRHGDAESKACA